MWLERQKLPKLIQEEIDNLDMYPCQKNLIQILKIPHNDKSRSRWFN